MATLYLGLVHYPIYNKNMQVIATAVTNFDIHDISRTARTYDVKKYFLIHPLEVQAEIIKRITDYWQHGYGKTYNPDRSNALERVTYTSSIESAIAAVTEIEGQAPVTITTDARTYPNTVTYGFVRKLLHSGDKPLLLLFGTGFGMEQFGVEVLVYLFAEIVDVYIDKVGPGIEMGLPNLFGYLYAAENPLCILGHVE